MMNYKNKNSVLLTAAALGLFAALFNSCKKYDNPPPVYEEYGRSQENFGERKVLVITIDGAVGEEVKKINPVTIASMLKNSKYSFSGVGDELSNGGSTWASMMTGVSSKKHRVIDENFTLRTGGDEHEAVVSYPSALARMLDVRPEFKAVTVTSSSPLNRYLVHADHRILTKNDQEVKDSVVRSLQNEDPRVVIADFKDVVTAGTTYGFSADIPAYKAAVVKADAYVGEILEALKKRKNYDKEDWLVILSSGHGGIGKSYGGPTSTERNIFSIFYSPNFKSLEMNAVPYYSVDFHGRTDDAGAKAAGQVINATAQDPAGLYNVGKNGITVEAKVLFNKSSLGTYNPIPSSASYMFLTKTSASSGDPGYQLFRFNANIYFWVCNGPNSAAISVGGVGEDSRWHNIAFTIAKIGDEFKYRIFIDGVKAAAEGVLPAIGINEISTKAPLVLGSQPSRYGQADANMNIADVKVWNTALSDETIKTNAIMGEVPASHPNYNNLVGYWPGNDGGGDKFKNKSKVANAPDFILTGKYNWNLFPVNAPAGYGSVDPDAVLLQNVDVTSQMFYWLRVPTKTEWNIDGTVWLSRYEAEFIKQ